MPPHLENASIPLSINPSTASWRLLSRTWDGALIGDARARVVYQQGRKTTRSLATWKPSKIGEASKSDTLQGPLESLTVDVGPDPAGVIIQLKFSLPADHPFLFIQIAIKNQGQAPVNINEIEFLRAGYPTTRRGYNDPEAVFWRGRPCSVYYHGRG